MGTDTIAWLVNDNPVGIATQVWSPPAGTINDGDSVKVRIILLQEDVFMNLFQLKVTVQARTVTIFKY